GWPSAGGLAAGAGAGAGGTNRAGSTGNFSSADGLGGGGAFGPGAATSAGGGGSPRAAAPGQRPRHPRARPRATVRRTDPRSSRPLHDKEILSAQGICGGQRRLYLGSSSGKNAGTIATAASGSRPTKDGSPGQRRRCPGLPSWRPFGALQASAGPPLLQPRAA